MPDYLKRTGRDVMDDIVIRIPESEKRVSRLSGPANKRLGIDRGSIPSAAAPLEGQMMIQYDDEAVGVTPVSADVGSTFRGESPYYYSNGAWRPFATGLSPDYGYYETDGVTVAADSLADDTWIHHSGAALLSLTDTAKPAFVARGVYAVTGTVSFGGGWPSPGTSDVWPIGYLAFHPDLLSWTTDFWFQSQPAGGHWSEFPPNVSFHATFQADVGSWLTLTYDNTDTGSSHAFSATQIRVQRIYSY